MLDSIPVHFISPVLNLQNSLDFQSCYLALYNNVFHKKTLNDNDIYLQIACI